MAKRLKIHITRSKKTHLPSAKKKQVFKKNSSVVSTGLKTEPLSGRREELFYNLNRNLFQLEKDMAYFNFAVEEIKDIIKFSYS